MQSLDLWREAEGGRHVRATGVGVGRVGGTWQAAARKRGHAAVFVAVGQGDGAVGGGIGSRAYSF